MQIYKKLKGIILFLLLFSCSRISAADYYWVGGTGNWSDISHWATSSGGGTMFFTAPTATDNVHFDVNSFTSGGQTVTINTSAICNDMIWTGVKFNPAFTCTAVYSLRIYGSITLTAGMSLSITGNVYFEATAPGKTITSAGKTFGSNIYLQGIGGGWILLDNIDVTGILSLSNGSLSTNNKTLSCGVFNSNYTVARSLTITNSSVVVKDWNINASNLTFDATNSSITANSFSHTGTPVNYHNLVAGAMNGGGSNFNLITGSPSITASGILNADTISATTMGLSASYVNVILAHGSANLGKGILYKKVIVDSAASIGGIKRIDYLFVGTDVAVTDTIQAGTAIIGGNGTFNSNNTFDTLILATGKMYVFEKSTTQTINKLLRINGKCSGYMNLQSSLAGTYASISKPAGNVTGNYLMLKDIRATGGAAFVANNSVDLGNNPGWTINSISQTDLYWVGGTGNWTDSSHWATSSGGVGGACSPNPNTNVHFDANSFTTPSQSVTLNTAIAYCNDMIWTGALFKPAFKCTAGRKLNIFSSLTLISGMSLSFSGDIYLNAPSVGKTITSAGNTIDGNVYFDNINGGWRLIDSIKVNNDIYFNKGHLNTNGKYVQSKSFNANDTSLRTLIIANSTINTQIWGVNGTNLNFNASNSLISNITDFVHSQPSKIYNNIASSKPSVNINGGDSKFNVITIGLSTLVLKGNNNIDSLLVDGILYISNSDSINYLFVKEYGRLGDYSMSDRQVIQKALFENKGYIYGNNRIKDLSIGDYGLIQGNNVIGNALLYGDGEIGGNNNFDTLSLFPGNIYKLEYNKTQTINGRLNMNGRCSAYITLLSSDMGYTAIISKSAGAVTGNYLIIRDVKAAGGAVFTANNSIGVANYPGWIINPVTPSNLYWIGGTGDWSDSSHWSFVSGGVGGACIPSPFDNVFFDSKSFSAANQIVTMNINSANCNSMDWTGSLYNPTFNLSSGKTIHIFGSLTLISSMNFIFDGHAYFEATTGGKTITSAGNTFNADVLFTGQGGEWTLSDNLNVGGSINLLNGKINTNSKKLTCYTFNSFVTSTREIDITNSEITVKTWGVIGINLTLKATNSVLKDLNTFRHIYNPKVYNNIISSNSSVSVQGGDSKFNLIKLSAGSLNLQGNNTVDSVVVNGDLSITDNNTINYVYSKGSATIGNNGNKQHIQKAVFDTAAVISGINKIGYLSIGGVALIQGTDTMGSVYLNDDATIDANNIYDTLTFASGKTYLLQDGKQQTINNQLNISGNNCFPTIIRSLTVGSVTTIFKSAGTVSADFIEIRDVKATGGASFFAGSHSSNLGNSPGWNFSTAPDFIYGLGKDTILCYGDLLRTSNLNGVTSFVWQDGSTNSFFKVTKPGAYWVKASFGQGCNYVDSIVISKVKPKPYSGFLINDTMQCIKGNSFIFTDTSTIDSGSISGYSWRFGDGKSDTIQNPTHIYGTADTFSLSMVATSSLGCKDSTLKSLFVYDPPKAGFLINDSMQCLSGNNFIFTNTTAIPQGAGKYLWDFGDGSKDTLTNTVHSYSNSGTFMVKLFVLSDLGCNDSISHMVYINPSGMVSFSINDTMQCLSINKFIFKDDIANDTLWNWDLGDGSTSLLDSFTYSYSTTDTFMVKLTVTSASGCRDSLVRTVIVQPSPKADFMAIDTSQCLRGNIFSFIPITTGYDIKNIFWDFGDTTSSVIDSPFHSYRYAGEYDVKSVFLSALGCSDSVTKKIYVHPMPVASFEIFDSSQCLERNDFGFVNKSAISIGSLSYLWDFGDTSTSILLNPHHQYLYAGTYTVWLRVTSQEGCTDSFEKHTYLNLHPKPKADYLINDSMQCLIGNKFNFTNTTLIKSGTFKQFWDFNDGATSDSLNKSHTYSTYDTFTTKLLIISDWGCKDSILKNVYINPMPMADFSINTIHQSLAGNNFLFTNMTNIPYGNLTHQWDYGDGATSSLLNGSHSYSLPDTFNVKLISVSDGGCPDSITKQVYVDILVTVDFNAKNFCLGDTVLFESMCNATPDSFRNYLWDFGDGATILRKNPRHVYADTGSYNVTLVGLTYLGYKNAASHTITILPKPVLSITYNKDTAFFKGGSTTLTANGTFDSILWSTGETKTDIVVRQAGNYSVRVIGSNGCDATEYIRIYLLESIPFSAMNVITPNDDGFNDVWKIQNIDQYRPCKVKIFNRWGDELYTTNDYKNDWGGTYNGSKLPEGTYYYFFETRDGVVYKGAINVLK